MAYHSETASKLFSRSKAIQSEFLFEKKLFTHFTSEEIVEISGEAGSGKTELLYHFIACCIFPSSWKSLKLGGIEVQVTFIDNDCHFDLFRFVTILENRIKFYASLSNVVLKREEIFLFVQNLLKLLHIVKCYDSDEFILTLNSLESSLSLQSRRNIIMIDGISSFYWSDKARVQNNYGKLTSHYRTITDLIIKISKSCGIPIITTRRKLLNIVDNDKKVFGQHWKSVVTWRFELEYKSSLPDQTVITLLNSMNSTVKQCVIKKLGLIILAEKS